MCESFCHVHNHTHYSLLDGANKIPELVRRAQELEMEALAITDHGVMFGVVEFHLECRKAGIKPLIGMEAYVAPNGRHSKGARDKTSHHLLLLAKDETGYRNLCRLHTAAALEGFYYRPRIDHEILRQHAAGLIGSSACLSSEVCTALLDGDYDQAVRVAAMYRDMFDPDSFFIELQDHRLPQQARIREPLIRLAGELGLPLVATNDAHYLCHDNHEAHDVLLCIGTGARVADADRLRFDTNEFYLKSKRQMADLFPDVPEALENTARIAGMCDLEISAGRALMPAPVLPEGLDSRQYLRLLAESGLRERVAEAGDDAWGRLNYELDVIARTGFEDYFLLVREFAEFTRSQGIAFGVRGSAAGSLVSYCLGITGVDPLEYDLTFERFLNPERSSMPDIDMDFEDARRGEVIQWVTGRYGQEHVAQIITFGTMAAKAAIKDAGRVMGYEPKETDRICKTIPNRPDMTIERAMRESTEFRQLVEAEDRVGSLVEIAKKIEGLARSQGVHAAGVVISRDPLSSHIPLYRGADGQPVTAFEMGVLEKLGLLKMDFLGLSNLTVLSRACRLIEDSGKPPVDIATIPLDDAKTFEMLGRGDTVGVFQLESGGMRRNITELKPGSVRELAAMVALYRPGPMEHIPAYIASKFGRRVPTFLHDSMRPILEETYGIIVYQDQVLKLVQALAGFTLAKADLLRRAIGKKDKAAMEGLQAQFLAGCQANGIPEGVAGQVWELLLPFADYAFNKAHAVCYALVAYQTAYLKANYPVEYMAALLSCYLDKEDRVAAFIEESRRQRIAVLPPDINRSGSDFQVEGRSIRFGLAAIKGVGGGLVGDILAERAKGPFHHLYEFCERTRGLGVTKLSLEALIRSGAFDALGSNRARLLKAGEPALAFADRRAREREQGQGSLFGGAAATGAGTEYPGLPEDPAPGRAETLAMEKEVLGIYVSDHPLRGYERVLHHAATHACASIAELEDGAKVTLAGVLTSVRSVLTKRGDRIGSLVLEDFSGQAVCVAFADAWSDLGGVLTRDAVVLVKGAVSHREMRGRRAVEVRVHDAEALPMPELAGEEDDEATLGSVTLVLDRARREHLASLREAIEAFPGAYRVFIDIMDNGRGADTIELLHRVDPSEEFQRRAAAAAPGVQVRVVTKRFLLGAAGGTMQSLEAPVDEEQPPLVRA
jgi:DNA polymerase-3 subunit alpha